MKTTLACAFLALVSVSGCKKPIGVADSIKVESAELDFGCIVPGTRVSLSTSVSADEPLSIVTPPARKEFAVALECDDLGMRCELVVDFDTEHVGLQGDTVVLGAGDATTTIALDALGATRCTDTNLPAPGLISVSTGRLDFLGTPVGDTTPAVITVKNQGSTDTTFVDVESRDPATFVVLENKCPRNLAPGASCGVRVGFRPALAGRRYESKLLVTGADALPVFVQVVGNSIP